MQDTAYITNNGDAMVKPKTMHTKATTCIQHHKNLLCESLMKLADLLRRGMPVQLSKTIGVRCDRGQAQSEVP